jgi:hypothetical protein
MGIGWVRGVQVADVEGRGVLELVLGLGWGAGALALAVIIVGAALPFPLAVLAVSVGEMSGRRRTLLAV